MLIMTSILCLPLIGNLDVKLSIGVPILLKRMYLTFKRMGNQMNDQLIDLFHSSLHSAEVQITSPKGNNVCMYICIPLKGDAVNTNALIVSVGFAMLNPSIVTRRVSRYELYCCVLSACRSKMSLYY